MAPNPTDVHAELRRIAVSHTFAASPRCCALLDQLVRSNNNQKYHGADRAVGMNLGMHLAAAVQLARLRNKLSDYYAAEGLDSPLRIRVPDEGYQVSIEIIVSARVEQSNPDVYQPPTEVPWLF